MSEASIPITKRLHISGLTPQFSQDALRERLSTYGKVLDIVGSEDSYLNGVGQRRPYAFATLQTTPQQLAKCMNTLSGAVWKGAKIRVGEAKPPWHERMATERAKLGAGDMQSKEMDRQRRRLRKRPWIGMEAHNMRPVTLERVQNGEWGWKVTPAGHLIRPMLMRPSRPIPRPTDAEVHKRHAPHRAPRLTLDPTRYQREHLSGRIFEALPQDDEAQLRWHWDDEAREWQALDAHDHCVATEKGPRERPTALVATSIDEPLEDELPTTLFEQNEEVPDELFDAPETSKDDQWWKKEDASTDLFDAPPTSQTDSWWNEADEPPASKSQPILRTNLLDDDEFSDGYEETEHVPVHPKDEKKLALDVVKNLFGESQADEPEPTSVNLSDDHNAKDVTYNASGITTEASQPSEKVHMESLKDMFQPTEDSGSLALFGSLVDEHDMAEDDDAVAGILGASNTAPEQTQAPAPAPTPVHTMRVPPFTTPFTLASGTPSLLPALFQRGSAPFWKVDTDEEIHERWLSKRSDLTQTYRQLHRDAIKKRKRRVVGSRAGLQHGGLAPVRGAAAPPATT